MTMKTRERVLLAALMLALSAADVQGQSGAAVGRGRGGGAGGGSATAGARARSGDGAPQFPERLPGAGASANHTCEVNEQLVNLGIGTFHCQGGDCRVGGLFANTVGQSITADGRVLSVRSGSSEI